MTAMEPIALPAEVDASVSLQSLLPTGLYARIPLGLALMAIGLVVVMTVKDPAGKVTYPVVAVGGGLELAGLAVLAGLVG